MNIFDPHIGYRCHSTVKSVRVELNDGYFVIEGPDVVRNAIARLLDYVGSGTESMLNRIYELERKLEQKS